VAGDGGRQKGQSLAYVSLDGILRFCIFTLQRFGVGSVFTRVSVVAWKVFCSLKDTMMWREEKIPKSVPCRYCLKRASCCGG